MKYVCPICKSCLRYQRIDDGVILQQIETDGSITEIQNSSDGSTEVFCSLNESHKLPNKLIQAVIDYVETHGS